MRICKLWRVLGLWRVPAGFEKMGKTIYQKNKIAQINKTPQGIQPQGASYQHQHLKDNAIMPNDPCQVKTIFLKSTCQRGTLFKSSTHIEEGTYGSTDYSV